jgi:hypothetical protein
LCRAFRRDYRLVEVPFHEPPMSNDRESSSSVHPRVQASRMEAAARGEYIARTHRDWDLIEAGGVPECLALIGVRDATTPEGAASIAIWLCQLATQYGFGEVAATLYNSSGRGYAGNPFPFINRTRAGLALVRQIIAVAAADNVDAERSRPPIPILPADAPGVGLWLAVLIEGAGLSEAAGVLWENRHADETPKARDEHFRLLSKSVRSLSAAATRTDGNPSLDNSMPQ